MTKKTNHNWQTKKLGEVLKLEYGKPLPKSKRKDGGLYPVYGANGEKDRTDEYYHDKQSIIIGRKGSAGEINLTEKKFWPLDVSYFVTFDYKKYDLNFLYYLLGNLELPKLAKGVKPGINRNEVYSIDIQIPPLSEQQRIVAILDEAFVAIATAKENAEKNLQNARELFESYLQIVFANPGDGWEEKKLGEVVSEMITGPFGSMLHKSDYVPEGVPVVNPQNIINGEIIPLQKTMVGQKTRERLTKYSLQEKDIVIARRGEMGRCAIVSKRQAGWLCGTGSMVIRLKKNADEKYLVLLLSSSKVKSILEKDSIGATMSNLNQGILMQITIPLPSLPDQRSIVSKLDALSAETKKLESIYRQKLADLDELKKSVLQKAFNGGLA